MYEVLSFVCTCVFCDLFELWATSQISESIPPPPVEAALLGAVGGPVRHADSMLRCLRRWDHQIKAKNVCFQSLALGLAIIKVMSCNSGNVSSPRDFAILTTVGYWHHNQQAALCYLHAWVTKKHGVRRKYKSSWRRPCY